MQKVTFENNVNGKTITFATDTPELFLESFDGNSLGSTPIVYKPLNYDGQRFISSNLNPRTIEMSVQFVGVENGRYSREKANATWREIAGTFAPGHSGRLTWTDGTKSRYIDCRIEEFPNRSQLLPWLFEAKLSLVADRPLWFDTAENTATISHDSNVLTNSSDVAVPFEWVFTVSGDTVFSLARKDDGATFGFTSSESGTYTVNTADCTVKDASGNLCNQHVSPEASYFWLLPGANNFVVAGGTAAAKWHDGYTAI